MKKHSQRQGSPKQFQAVKTSPHLHVAHPKHTGHMLPHRTTSYPTLAMIVLCVGVFLFSWTHFVTADPGPVTASYTVHARVAGPPPSQPATIDSPADGTNVTSQLITVSGSCPQNTYEVLYRNGVFSGVALCDATGSYQLQADLFTGTNKLQVGDFSVTDIPGPLSSVVLVTYTSPSPPPSSGPNGNNGSSPNTTPTLSNSSSSTPSPVNSVVQSEPLIFKTTFAYLGQNIGENGSWSIDLEGGAAPYAISVDWGDGSHFLISRPRAGTFTIDHAYKKAGGYRGSYIIKLSASDATGNQTFMQLLTIVNNPPSVAAVTQRNQVIKGGIGSSPSTYLTAVMKYVWPGYGIVVLMLTSFWLGERREYHYLFKPHLKKARRA